MPLKSALIFVMLVALSYLSNAQVSPPVLADSTSGDPSVFDLVEIEANYPGGIQAWRQFLEKNLRPQVATERGAPEGYYTVMVRFVVDKEGNVTDIKALTKLGYGMEEEVIRIMKKSGKWNPGEQNGRVVNSYHTQPITFVVEDEEVDLMTLVPNKLFAGVENIITISLYKTKPEDVYVTMTNGKITPLSIGKYSVIPTDTLRRAVITVQNIKKKEKQARMVSIEVRPRREAPDAKKD